MNPKLIFAALAGVSALGGGVAGGYYYFKADTSNSEKQTNDTRTTDSLESTAPKPEAQENSAQGGLNPEKVTLGPDSPKQNVEGQGGSSPQNVAVREPGTSSTGTGGVAATSVAGDRGESGSVGPQV